MAARIEPDAAERDAAARELALDPRRSIVLEAPAGSGKTTVLTRRFLRLLCEVDDPEQILAITFTRKAAGEMRERVLRALRAGEDPLARAARERSQARGWSLEIDPGRLRIQTIDSFNRWLASRLPLAARGAGAVEVMEDPQALYRQAARRTLLDAESDERLQADAERLFERLDNDFGRFERLLTEMLRVRAHWLPVLLEGARELELHERGTELPARVEASLRTIVEERLRHAQAAVPAALVEEGALLAQESARRRAQAEAAEGASWQAWLSPPAPGEPLGLRHWQGLAQLALTQEGRWRRTLTRREGFPPDDKPLKERALVWLARLAEVRGARERLIELSMLPDPRLSAEDGGALASLARVLQLAASELAVVFAESRRVDFAHVAAAARGALAEEGAPSDLALRLGTDIRHILVDEFQDTSIEQCALLEALTAGWEEGDGRSLFVVGDPMQSIYQFREAEVGLFLRAATHGLGRLKLEPLALTRNFRALPALVDWLNEAFPRCFPELDDPRASAVRYRPCIAGRGSECAGGGVHLHPTPRGDARAEARAIAELVRRMRESESEVVAGGRAPSVAILVASRAHAVPIVSALQAAGIAVEGVDLAPLGELPVVRDLEALARALDHLADRTAWLTVLRAPWCGLTLADLTTLLERAPSLTIWEAVHDEERVRRLPADAQARLARTRGALARALEARDRLPLADWVERTWLRLGGPAACREEADLEHARTFFARLAAWCAEPGWPGPLALAERLESLHASSSGPEQDAVQIMTIHRAKGLEFDHVIVPGLGRRVRGGAEPLLRWLELPRDSAGSDLLMAAIPPPWRRGEEPLSEYLKSLEARRSANERARLIYVAATRARSTLHLFAEPPRAEARGQEGAPASGTLLAALWPAVAAAFARAAEESGSAPAQASSDAGNIAPEPRALERLPADWRLPDPPLGPPLAAIDAEIEAPAPAELDSREAAARVVCDQLRRSARHGRLPQRGTDALARALEGRLARLGLTEADRSAALREAIALLDACLADRELQWMFSSRHIRAEGPLRLSGLHEGRLVSASIDRTFVDEEGVRWLVNFEVAGSDAQAILRGLALARSLGPEPVRGGLYDPAARAFRELDPSSA
jgi:ATP-dependent helicase/nuclease subunit A